MALQPAGYMSPGRFKVSGSPRWTIGAVLAIAFAATAISYAVNANAAPQPAFVLHQAVQVWTPGDDGPLVPLKDGAIPSGYIGTTQELWLGVDEAGNHVRQRALSFDGDGTLVKESYLSPNAKTRHETTLRGNGAITRFAWGLTPDSETHIDLAFARNPVGARLTSPEWQLAGSTVFSGIPAEVYQWSYGDGSFVRWIVDENQTRELFLGRFAPDGTLTQAIVTTERAFIDDPTLVPDDLWEPQL